MHRRKLSLLLILAALVIGINGLAFMHARAMCRFTEAGAKTPKPEDLTWPQKFRILFTGINNPKPRNTRTPRDLGLPFETERISGPNGTLELWVVETPNSRATVVAFHGYSEAKQQLLDLAGPMRRLGCNVVMVDFFGSGGSSGSLTTIGYREALDVGAAVDHARKKYPGQPVVLYGVSMGGAAVLRAMHSHGVQPDAVVLEGVFDTMIEATKRRFKLIGVPGTPLSHVLLFWGGVYAGFNPFTFRPVDDAKSVDCPTLVLHGELDQRVTPVQSRRLFERLPGWKYISEYPGVGHELVYASDPGRWERDFGLLLERLGE